MGIGISLMASATPSINEQYDMNFAEVRAQAEQADNTVCIGLDDAACKIKLKKVTVIGLRFYCRIKI